MSARERRFPSVIDKISLLSLARARQKLIYNAKMILSIFPNIQRKIDRWNNQTKDLQNQSNSFKKKTRVNIILYFKQI